MASRTTNGFAFVVAKSVFSVAAWFVHLKVSFVALPPEEEDSEDDDDGLGW